MLERFRDALGAASTSVLRSSSWDLRSTPNNAIDHGNQGHATVERYEIFDSVLMSAPSTTAKNKSALNYFPNLKIISDLLDSGRYVGDESGPVKVAIIDAGIHPSHPHIDRIYGYCDFSESVIANNEGTHHGSNMGHLIHTVAPCAEIYVAHAVIHVRDVRKVDIISMSFGFRNEPEEFLEVIQNTYDNLMFESASNFDSKEEASIRFPARLKHRVICINSADGNGNPSGGNPPHDPQRDNFSILGEDVPLGREFIPGLEPCAKFGDGASMATAIAAGVAALVLGFARRDEHREVRFLASLKSQLGMSAVLRAMTKGGVKGGSTL
ncbi:hypothetical protein EYC84_001419 [Monilinia fructicola]|uniref:Peptidase S8/S53 domain-containing protein n=1 Tax=Monilinia fructicola TaxID=38448 RepID=A0A5M9JU78_MONFR|nr:hypothetical protein EYC84_001419 [Monilinia fructicola]